jgi:hypothetical protein
MGCDENSEQIIYIAYETDDKNAIVQILDQNLVSSTVQVPHSQSTLAFLM